MMNKNTTPVRPLHERPGNSTATRQQHSNGTGLTILLDTAEIRRQRKARKLTIAQCAIAGKYDRQEWANLECRPSHSCTLRTLERIAIGLEMDSSNCLDLLTIKDK